MELQGKQGVWEWEVFEVSYHSPQFAAEASYKGPNNRGEGVLIFAHGTTAGEAKANLFELMGWPS